MPQADNGISSCSPQALSPVAVALSQATHGPVSGSPCAPSFPFPTCREYSPGDLFLRLYGHSFLFPMCSTALPGFLRVSHGAFLPGGSVLCAFFSLLKLCCVCVCMCVCAHTCVGQRTICKSWFPPPTTWVPELSAGEAWQGVPCLRSHLTPLLCLLHGGLLSRGHRNHWCSFS